MEPIRRNLSANATTRFTTERAPNIAGTGAARPARLCRPSESRQNAAIPEQKSLVRAFARWIAAPIVGTGLAYALIGALTHPSIGLAAGLFTAVALLRGGKQAIRSLAIPLIATPLAFAIGSAIAHPGIGFTLGLTTLLYTSVATAAPNLVYRLSGGFKWNPLRFLLPKFVNKKLAKSYAAIFGSTVHLPKVRKSFGRKVLATGKGTVPFVAELFLALWAGLIGAKGALSPPGYAHRSHEEIVTGENPNTYLNMSPPRGDPEAARKNLTPDQVRNWKTNPVMFRLELPRLGVSLEYVQATPPADRFNGETVVLNHGAPDNARNFANALQKFYNRGYKVVVWSRPEGSGSTSTLAFDKGGMPARGALMAEATGALDIRSAHVINHSYGSLPFWEAYLTQEGFPEKVTDVIDVATANPAFDPTPQATDPVMFEYGLYNWPASAVMIRAGFTTGMPIIYSWQFIKQSDEETEAVTRRVLEPILAGSADTHLPTFMSYPTTVRLLAPEMTGDIADANELYYVITKSPDFYHRSRETLLPRASGVHYMGVIGDKDVLMAAASSPDDPVSYVRSQYEAVRANSSLSPNQRDNCVRFLVMPGTGHGLIEEFTDPFVDQCISFWNQTK